MIGTGIGLLLGLIFTAFVEVPRLFRIQNIEDAKHYTMLPVLASVPPLLSADEKQWIRRSRQLKLLAAFAGAIGIVPVIVIVLQMTRVFEKLIS